MKKTPKIDIIHTSFNIITRSQLITELLNKVNHSEKTFLVTANPEIVYYAEKHSTYQQILNKADYVIADGYGVILASKIIGEPLPERIPGFEVMNELLALGDTYGWSAYFLGAKREVIEQAVLNIKDQYPNLKISGYRDGYFVESEQINQEIKNMKPDLVFVALGFPKQETWIFENYSEMEKGLFIGVGGSFDVIAGVVKRAPLFWRKMNLEWFYRLIKQPSRWKRMLVLPIFVLKIIKNRLFKRN